MSLRPYWQKRDFTKTREPRGKKSSCASQQFVIHKHAARHLHYDLRLEMGGVLKSWAVPKGPSLDPTVKRLAIQVEDHPLEYGKFEGVIPAGEYGGGTVMLWDRGEWYSNENAETAYKKGTLSFELKGEKLQGRWKLIRIKQDPKNWLLMKVADAAACSQDKYDVTAEKTLSVLTNRSMTAIEKETKPAAKKNSVVLTHPNRILYTQSDITKLQLAQYYKKIADRMLPYLINRPLTVIRCPQGQEKKCFIQRHWYSGLGKGIISFSHNDNNEPYFYIRDLDGLLALVQMNILEIHIWGARIDKIHSPDIMVLDLDPGPHVQWEQVITAAKMVRGELAEYNLQSFVKTTGSKGLHVVVPLQRRHCWDEVRNFSQQFAQYLESKNTHLLVSSSSKAKREGKIFIDYVRNHKGATAIAPFSPRAKPNAPVATPLAWEELSVRIRSDHYHIKNLSRRLGRLRQDPWQDFFNLKQKLPTIK